VINKNMTHLLVLYGSFFCMLVNCSFPYLQLSIIDNEM